jgi:hypothetical protein
MGHKNEPTFPLGRQNRERQLRDPPTLPSQLFEVVRSEQLDYSSLGNVARFRKERKPS